MDYNLDGLNDFEKEMAMGYIQCAEMNVNIVNEWSDEGYNDLAITEKWLQ